MYTHPASLNGVMSFLLPSYFMKCKPCVAEKSDDSDWVQNVSKYAKNQILHTGTPPLTLFFETLKNNVSRKPCC